MTQKLFLLFILFIFPFQEVHSLPRCRKAFVKRESRLLAEYPHEDFKNPLTGFLLEGYKEADKTYWIGKKKQVAEFANNMIKTIEFLEGEYMEASFSTAAFPELLLEGIRKIPEIVEFANTIPEEEAFSFHLTVQSIFAFFGKHLPTALKMSNQKEVKWSAINSILKAIAEFDEDEKPKFSLYKIGREIEKWYSRKEYILCRT